MNVSFCVELFLFSTFAIFLILDLVCTVSVLYSVTCFQSYSFWHTIPLQTLSLGIKTCCIFYIFIKHLFLSPSQFLSVFKCFKWCLINEKFDKIILMTKLKIQISKFTKFVYRTLTRQYIVDTTVTYPWHIKTQILHYITSIYEQKSVQPRFAQLVSEKMLYRSQAGFPHGSVFMIFSCFYAQK